MNQYIRQYIDQGYAVITASQRQARYLRMRYAAVMQAEGKSVWRTPAILPWKAWLHECWGNSQVNTGSTPLLLGQSQVKRLWQSIIEKQQPDGLLQVNTVVETAMRAHTICREWQLEIFPKDVYLNGDALAFRGWVKRYRQKLARNNWLDEYALPEYLQSVNYIPDVPGVVIYGYDQLTPQQATLVDYLKTNRRDVVLIEPDGRNLSTTCFRLPEPQDEIQHAAVWARRCLAENPGATIGIVVQDLEHKRGDVTAVFDDILNPGWVLTRPGAIQRLYSIAPGRPLSAYPVIHAALELLSLGHPRQPIQRLEFLLRSSFIKGVAGEAGLRARFYTALRETGEPAWRLQTLLKYIDHHRQYLPVADNFVAMLRERVALSDILPRKQTPRQWTETFSICLQGFGWPGDRPLDSTEYQTVAEWREALLELAGLGTVVGEWTYNEAMQALNEVLDNRSFQPETVETPVQISGLPGLAGMEFDYLWVTGMHDLSWPGPAIANPFIPLSLQREAGVPGSSAALALQQCVRETGLLVNATGHIVFSFAGMKDDTEYRPSAILKKYLSDLPEKKQPVINYKQVIFAAREMETFTDVIAPAFPGDDGTGGGSGILTDQSACPFRAFARHRLHATGLAAIDIGLDPAVRGLLVHAVMQGIWNRIGNADELKAMADNTRDALIHAVVTGAIRRQAGRQPETFTSEFRGLEERRLQSLAQAWLEIEKQRPAFSVRDRERRHEVNFHGLDLRMRIDRIDELADGSLVVIDYKTGEVSTGKWQGDRPEEPQLPLYAITLGGDVQAVAFAGMKKGKLGFTGLGAEADIIEGVKAVTETSHSWQDQFEEWETVLGKLAEEYKQGQAGVTPTDKACRYCDLHSLCRIHERLVSTPGMTDNDSSEPLG